MAFILLVVNYWCDFTWQYSGGRDSMFGYRYTTVTVYDVATTPFIIYTFFHFLIYSTRFQMLTDLFLICSVKTYYWEVIATIWWK